MSERFTMTYRYDNDGRYSDVMVSETYRDDAHLHEIIEQFQDFLEKCGYSFENSFIKLERCNGGDR